MLVLLAVWLITFSTSYSEDNEWRQIAKGLDLARFRVDAESFAGDSTIVVLRIDPDFWVFDFLTAGTANVASNMTARDWCEEFGYSGAINAGMFHKDYKNHVGYMKDEDSVYSMIVNKYKSAAAFDPIRRDLPLFHMYDLDETEMDSVEAKYHCVVQNLRLVKRPGINRWSQDSKRWSEAALGQDDRGRVLFIFCTSPYTMHDFNNMLLSLPINLTCAQHLEGGPEAQLCILTDSLEHQWFGSYETGPAVKKQGLTAWPIPNVIAIKPRGK